MTRCPNCGYPTVKDASFCTACGYQLLPIADPNNVAAASQTAEEAKVASRERVRHRAEARDIRFQKLADSIDAKALEPDGSFSASGGGYSGGYGGYGAGYGGAHSAMPPARTGTSGEQAAPSSDAPATPVTSTTQGTAPRMDVTPHSLELVRSFGRSIRLDCDGVFVRCRTYRYGSCRTCISVPIRAISSVGIARRFRVWLFILGLVMVAGAVLCFSEGIGSAGGLVLLGIVLLFLAVGTICSAFIKMFEIRYDGTAISIGTWGATLSEMQPFIDDLNEQVAQDELMCRYGGVMPRR